MDDFAGMRTQNEAPSRSASFAGTGEGVRKSDDLRPAGPHAGHVDAAIEVIGHLADPIVCGAVNDFPATERDSFNRCERVSIRLCYPVAQCGTIELRNPGWEVGHVSRSQLHPSRKHFFRVCEVASRAGQCGRAFPFRNAERFLTLAAGATRRLGNAPNMGGELVRCLHYCFPYDLEAVWCDAR